MYLLLHTVENACVLYLRAPKQFASKFVSWKGGKLHFGGSSNCQLPSKELSYISSDKNHMLMINAKTPDDEKNRRQMTWSIRKKLEQYPILYTGQLSHRLSLTITVKQPLENLTKDVVPILLSLYFASSFMRLQNTWFYVIYGLQINISSACPR